MGATRKRTRSSSDSMPDPNFARLRQCADARCRSDGGFGARREPKLGDHVELAHVAGELQEREQPGTLARAERIAQLLEVTGEEPGRVAVPLARLVREPLGLGAGETD